MDISQSDIDNLAALARIDLSEEERRVFRSQMESILEYAQQVQEVDTSSVDMASHVFYDVDQFRDDAPRQPTVAKEIVDQFPEKAGNLNQVKAVMDKTDE